MNKMTTLTVSGNTYEIVDEQARNDIESIKDISDNFNNHNNNDDIHISVDERDNWNDKYTKQEVDIRINSIIPRATIENNKLVINSLINDVSINNNVLRIS